MTIYHLNSLTEDELEFLLYSLNKVNPIVLNGYLNETTVLGVRTELLINRLNTIVKPKMNKMYYPLLDSLIHKLSRTYLNDIQEKMEARQKPNPQLEFTSLLDELTKVDRTGYVFEQQLEFSY